MTECELVDDLLAVSQGQSSAGRDSRQVAWDLLLRLADEGSTLARNAIGLVRRPRKNTVKPNRTHSTAKLGDVFPSLSTN
jgi:hypothetical protein